MRNSSQRVNSGYVDRVPKIRPYHKFSLAGPYAPMAKLALTMRRGVDRMRHADASRQTRLRPRHLMFVRIESAAMPT